jgi:SAM-dependent methyltransferase
MARFLADRGCSVVGVDLSPGMLATARRAHPDLEVHEGSLTALPFGDGSFDGVLFWYSQIHLPDEAAAEALAEAARVLRPGGYVLVGSQKGQGTFDVGAGLRERGHDVALTRWHRGPRELLDLLRGAGLERVPGWSANRSTLNGTGRSSWSRGSPPDRDRGTSVTPTGLPVP